MTSNQIAYWNLKELERANKEKERETKRANIAKESETKRSNLANEDILVSREEGLNKRFNRQFTRDTINHAVDEVQGVLDRNLNRVGKVIQSIFG